MSFIKRLGFPARTSNNCQEFRICFTSFSNTNRNFRLNMDKELTNFPKSFKFTPYEEYDFNSFTKNICHANLELLKVCKMIILGDLHVGKTSIFNRFCNRIFDSNYRSTIGVDFQTEQINIKGISYNLQIWDTAGQERFKCIAQCYYRKAHVVIIVFDLSSIRSLASCKNWLRDALDASKDQRPFIFLVGSKKDLLSPEAYKSVEDIAIKSAKILNAEFWSVSSKTGENVDTLFYRAAALSFNKDLCTIMSEDNDTNRSRVYIGNDLVSFHKYHRKKEENKKNCGHCLNLHVK